VLPLHQRRTEASCGSRTRTSGLNDNRHIRPAKFTGGTAPTLGRTVRPLLRAMPPAKLCCGITLSGYLTGTDSYRDLIGATLAFRYHNKLVAGWRRDPPLMSAMNGTRPLGYLHKLVAGGGVAPAILHVMSVKCTVHYPAIKVKDQLQRGDYTHEFHACQIIFTTPSSLFKPYLP